MSPCESPAVSASVAKLDPVLCTSAAARLIWAAGAVAVLWTIVLWALD